jgi:gamma-glutamylcyclotransferase (GGCT)/AIG2-like uncharacterized protein YtfP
MNSRRKQQSKGGLYFGYGSNISHRQMADRVPDAKRIGKAILPGYRLTFVGYSRGWGGGVANIVPLANWKVPGALYQMTEDDFALMDQYEGHPTIYRRVMVEVKVGNKKRMATTYVRARAGEAFSAPSEAYVNRILEGYKDEKFEKNYEKALKWAADAKLYPPDESDTFPTK